MKYQIYTNDIGQCYIIVNNVAFRVHYKFNNHSVTYEYSEYSNAEVVKSNFNKTNIDNSNIDNSNIGLTRKDILLAINNDSTINFFTKVNQIYNVNIGKIFFNFKKRFELESKILNFMKNDTLV